jgi:hypothetical protein
MSEEGLPLVVLNMGAEMVYILRQRLSAQKITEDKTGRGNSLSPLSPTPHCMHTAYTHPACTHWEWLTPLFYTHPQ